MCSTTFVDGRRQEGGKMGESESLSSLFTLFIP